MLANSPPLRLSTRVVAGLAVIAVLAGDAADSAVLQRHAFRIVNGAPADPSAVGYSGNTGIYLGDGLILTAAHVAGNPLNPEPIGILVENRFVPVRFVKAGDFNDVDVTLLAAYPAASPKSLLALRRLSLCPESAAVGRPVVIVEPNRVTASVIVPPNVLPPGISWKFSSLIHDVTTTGNSGSGVFDRDSGCLLGIMSRKVEATLRDANGNTRTEGIAKYFVPADQIVGFLGNALHPNIAKPAANAPEHGPS